MNILDIIVMREMRLNTQLDIIQTSNESTIYEQVWQFLILYKWDCFWSIKECGDFDFSDIIRWERSYWLSTPV